MVMQASLLSFRGPLSGLLNDDDGTCASTLGTFARVSLFAPVRLRRSGQCIPAIRFHGVTERLARGAPPVVETAITAIPVALWIKDARRHPVQPFVISCHNHPLPGLSRLSATVRRPRGPAQGPSALRTNRRARPAGSDQWSLRV